MNDLAEPIARPADPARMLRQIERAIHLAGDLWTLADLVDMARDGKIQMWSEGDAFACTEVRIHPRRRVLNVFLVAGRMRDIRRLEFRLERFAREQGASVMIAAGREAWGRIGAPMGWHPWAVEYVKPLMSGEGGNA